MNYAKTMYSMAIWTFSRQPIHGVQRRMISVVNFFRIFEIIIFCFVVAICDLLHDVETIFHLSYVLTLS